ncbi:zona pellucida protein C [Entelurus aequoreus]|uniref:zona pellucida protein C n=1 Tax=Entelurus aequoreus TaxID=161455 RepID=UPI002B1D0F18|nr:zona pellucida protein C [Entelurus aequoreus]
MEGLKFFFCLFWIHSAETVFSQHVQGFFQNILPFPFEISNDFGPFDSIFSSWRTTIPDFEMFAELSPLMNVPEVQVYCDESELILLVDKNVGDVTLSRGEIQLGDGCYSNSELPNQLMFTYSFDQCGTSHEMQNGLDVLSNALHFNSRRLTPSTVHVSCVPNRPKAPSLPDSAVLPDHGRHVSIQAMTSSWSRPTESNIYTRGQVINMEVAAKIRPHQRLFIKSCFVSSSPQPHTKPRHAVIINKGCTVPLDSLYPAVQFIDSHYLNVVKFALNTTYLISEMYVHCTVLVSDQKITTGSKSCNFDLVNSRWQELSGNVEVCSCCTSKCKSLSFKHLPHDAKAVVSTGPFVIAEMEEKPAPSDLELDWNSMQSDSAALEERTSEPQWSSPPIGVVVVRQDPIGSLKLVLPEPMQHESNDASQLAGDSSLNALQREINLSNVKGQSANRPLYQPLLLEKTDKSHAKYAPHQKRTNNVLPIIHSKIQLSKSSDGSQTLSFEELTAQDGGKTKILEAESEWKPRRQRLLSIFRDLLRRMHKAE